MKNPTEKARVEGPDSASNNQAEPLPFTEAEYAALLAVAFLDGLTVEEVIANAARETLIRRFGCTRRAGVVLPFRPLSGPEKDRAA